MGNGRRRFGLFGLARLAPVMVGGFVAALMIGGAATGALLTSSESSTDAPPATDNGASAVVVAADVASTTLTVDKVGPARAVPGEPIDYEIFVDNEGAETAVGVVLVDVVPTGTTISGELPEGCEAKAWTGEYDIPVGAAVVVCALADIPADDGTIVDLAFVAAGAGAVTNKVTVAAENADPVSDTDTFTVTDPTTGILLQKDAPALATVGAEFTYTLTVQNVGDVIVNEVRVDDDLPAGLEFVRSDSGCVAAGGSVSCTLGTIGTGASKPASFVVKATSPGKRPTRRRPAASAPTASR